MISEKHKKHMNWLNDKVAEFYNIDPKSIKINCRKNKFVNCRKIVIAIYREFEPDITLRELGEYYKRDHATASYYVDYMNNINKTYGKIEDVYRMVRELYISEYKLYERIDLDSMVYKPEKVNKRLINTLLFGI